MRCVLIRYLHCLLLISTLPREADATCSLNIKLKLKLKSESPTSRLAPRSTSSSASAFLYLKQGSCPGSNLSPNGFIVNSQQMNSIAIIGVHLDVGHGGPRVGVQQPALGPLPLSLLAHHAGPEHRSSELCRRGVLQSTNSHGNTLDIISHPDLYSLWFI